MGSYVRILASLRTSQTQTITGVAFKVAKLALVGHVFQRYIGFIRPTDGISMVPTMPASYLKRPYILYSALHRRGRGLKVGDVVIYTHPLFSSESGCKRIVGMPGDFVSVITPGRKDEDIDAEDVDDKWAHVKEQVVRVPEGHCWVAGDNLEWSRDSRLYGALPLGLVKAKVLAVVLPIKDAKWLGSTIGVKDAQQREHEWIVQR